MIRKLYAVTLVAASAGCATGPAFVEADAVPPGKAQIYVYRKSQFIGAASTYSVFLDGQREGALWLANGSFLRYVVEPGSHNISSVRRFEPLNCGASQLQIPAGATAYVELLVGQTGVVYATPTVGITIVGCGLQERSAEKALAELAGLKNNN